MNKIQPEQRSMPDINPDKVCFVIEKSRELESEEVGATPDGSNAADDGGHNVLTEVADAPIRHELTEFIEGLDIDEQLALVALAWIGRGDFEPEHWEAAVQLATERRERRTSAYLLEIPQLSEFLEEALADFGCSCEDFDASA
jgi:hypothetical protein